MNNKRSIVEVLLRIELDINLQDKDNRTALILACMHGEGAIVRELLQKEGLNVNVQDKDGRTALMWACINGREYMVQWILYTQGIDMNLRDKNNRTAFMWASMYKHGRCTELIKRRVLLQNTQN